MIAAMILAGGTGSRVGADRPKQFIELNGKPIVAYTAEIYQKFTEIDAIEIVCHPQWKEYLESVVKKFKISKVKWICTGGNTFQESVIHGIKTLENYLQDDDIVMIHYAASPFTSQKILNDAIRVCKIHKMSASCTPCFQLLGSNDGEGESKTWIDRDKIVQIACPQSFKFSYLKEIYSRAEKQNLLEKTEPHTTSLMYALGDTIYESYGDQTNIKITTAEDVEFFKKYQWN